MDKNFLAKIDPRQIELTKKQKKEIAIASGAVALALGVAAGLCIAFKIKKSHDYDE